MAASDQKKRASQGKPHFLKNPTHFKLSKHEQSMVIREAFLHIAMLKFKIEALRRKYEDFKIIRREPLHQFQEVKVEKIGENFQVKIKSLKGDNKLVNILETFEEMGLTVAQARASCRVSFDMEAIVVPQSKDKLWSVDDMIQTLVKSLVKPNGPL
uniref:Plant bHLH transcription factor ACT-like domain-containing protein n=1 Tax=Noccaea caerulescens TaxID=107243 RepID=A0A1J3HKX6_NOCCA